MISKVIIDCVRPGTPNIAHIIKAGKKATIESKNLNLIILKPIQFKVLK